MRYAIKLVRDGDTFVASCRDLPAFNSVGDSEADALRESIDAIILVLQWHIDGRQPLPRASAKRHGEHWVAVPALADDWPPSAIPWDRPAVSFRHGFPYHVEPQSVDQ